MTNKIVRILVHHKTPAARGATESLFTVSEITHFYVFSSLIVFLHSKKKPQTRKIVLLLSQLCLPPPYDETEKNDNKAIEAPLRQL